MTLASTALRHIHPPVVPRVFAWGAAEGENAGWILQEFMPGVALAEPFEAMPLEEKRPILAQMAGMLKLLQDFPLPESVKGWGGVMFDGEGKVVSGPMVSVWAGPWGSLEEEYRERIAVALGKAERSSVIKGWRENGVRERIDAFVDRGLDGLFRDVVSKVERTIVHADFSKCSCGQMGIPELIRSDVAADNLLYNPATGRITALLDYDFSSIQHPAYEYFRSFATNGG